MSEQLKNFKDYALDWRNWFRGLIGATIGGGANAVTVMVVAPESFNFQSGWKKLAVFTLGSAIFSAALYLKQHPIPEEKQ